MKKNIAFILVIIYFFPFGSKFLMKMGFLSLNFGTYLYSANIIYAKSSNYFLQEGIKKMDKNNFDGAIIDFNKALEINPTNIQALFKRGKVKEDIKDYLGAIADFNQILLIDENNKLGYLGRGHAKNHLKDYKGAIADFNKAISLDTRDGDAYFMRGRAKANLKDYEGAIIDLTKQIKNNFRIWGEKDAQSYLERGKAKANLKDYEGAMSDFNKAIRFDKKNSNGYFQRGILNYEIGNKEQSCSDWLKSSSLGNVHSKKQIVEYCL